MKTKNCDDVGYHYMVHPNGTIYEGRKIFNKRSHVESFNSGKIGVLFMRDSDHQFWDDDDDLSTSHLRRVNSLITTLKKHFFQISQLGGHKEFLLEGVRSCPGNEIMRHMNAIRDKHRLGKPKR